MFIVPPATAASMVPSLTTVSPLPLVLLIVALAPA